MSPYVHAVVAPVVLAGVAVLMVTVCVLTVGAVILRGCFELGQGVGQWLLNRTG